MHAKICISVVGAIGLIGVTPALAQTKKQVEARYSNEYNRCMKTGLAADGVTSGIMDCSGTEIRRQDARLNAAYKMVIARSTTHQKTMMRTSERNWVSQRNKGCDRIIASLEGGTLAMMIYSGCILDETIKRTIWLEQYKG